MSAAAASNDGSTSILSAEEAELYDRQIRLWGVDAQKQLRQSRLLVLGHLNYTATEAAKNLVLAGVGAVTLCDVGAVGAEDVATNFVYSNGDVGKKRCDVMQHALHTLNPTVDIKVSMRDVTEVDSDYLKSSACNILLMVSSDEASLKQISEMCHVLEIKYFAANCYGGFGYFFMDLGEHHYYEKTSGGENNVGEMSTEVEQVKKCVVYRDMNSFFKRVWSSAGEISVRRLPGLRTYFIIRAILYYLKTNTSVTEESADDLEKCVELVKEGCVSGEAGGGDVALAGVEEDLAYAAGELCAAGAILGAALAQEVIQVISQAGRPHDNCVLLDVRNIGLHVVNI